MKETERLLRRLILGHFMLKLASLLCKGAYALVNPLVTVNFDLSCRFRACGNDTIDLFLVVKKPIISQNYSSGAKGLFCITWRLSGRDDGCCCDNALDKG